ncbi:MAG: c-type cytochrome [Akkermansiaceae bacterium]|nr:c-type cytochrome [Akkermansiaceae bacterium]
MSNSVSNKPDLDDSTNVNMDAAAAKRENHMFTEGAEPLSLWVILGSALVVLIAGGVLFGGNVFDYKNFVKKGYIRKAAPNAGGGGAKPKLAIVAYKAIGKKVYDSCSTCHQPGGEGNTAFPPLADSEWVTGPSLRPAMIILQGLHKPIMVNGKRYEGVMPTMGDGMDAKKLAGVLNYIRNSFGNKADKLITVEMAEDALLVSKERGSGPVTADELNEKYNRELKGAELAMETPVDPKTLEPTAAE